jgi:hypothetical protein
MTYQEQDARAEVFAALLSVRQTRDETDPRRLARQAIAAALKTDPRYSEECRAVLSAADEAIASAKVRGLF